ncbi:hypothetical protein, partial [Cronobacter turicensis]|uniref:hypothetical protein n=1 Tax=Cronobacter turicensis TaxID=413502 RepID=UPI0018F86860
YQLRLIDVIHHHDAFHSWKGFRHFADELQAISPVFTRAIKRKDNGGKLATCLRLNKRVVIGKYLQAA